MRSLPMSVLSLTPVLLRNTLFGCAFVLVFASGTASGESSKDESVSSEQNDDGKDAGGGKEVRKAKKAQSKQEANKEALKKDSEKAQAKDKSVAKKVKTAAVKSKAEAYGEERIDPSSELGSSQSDDFKDLDKRAAAYKKAFSEESEDERIARELKELKEKEQEDARAKALADAAERERVRKIEAEEYRKNIHQAQVMEQDAEEKAKHLPGISHDEMDWKGLQD